MSKLGRNDPCNCGSGKKYKHCCADPTKNNKLAQSRIHFSPISEKSSDAGKIISITNKLNKE